MKKLLFALCALALSFAPAQAGVDTIARGLAVQAPRVIFQGVGSHTGDLVETTLASGTVSSMGPNSLIRVRLNFAFTGTAGTKTIKIKFGSVVYQFAAAATATNYQIDTIIQNQGATGSQQVLGFAIANNGAVAVLVPVSGAVDTTQAQTVSVTGTLASAADSLSLIGGSAVLQK